MHRGSIATLTQRLALVHAAVVSERLLGGVSQTAETRGGGAAIRGKACGALGYDVACRDEGGGDASGQSDGSDEGDEGFLEEHCGGCSVKAGVDCLVGLN